jgi:very-short-patch-repair endonuclease
MRDETPRLVRTDALRAQGWTKRQIAVAVASDQLVRLRIGAFASPLLPADVLDAGRMLGRLTGASELRRLGVFVLSVERVDINVQPSASRLPHLARAHRVHRRVLMREPHPDALVVEPIDAVYDAVLVQPPRAAIATIDSALHLGVIRSDDLDELFAALPRRYRRLRRLLDSRAESGPETLLRLILRALGRAYDCQVVIPGVGRVDFLVDGWLIVECDSEAHHASWAAQKSDRRRDLAAAQLGLVTIRVIAEDILWHSDEVRAALAGLLAARHLSRTHGRSLVREILAPRTAG